jgi:site-specific DNA recombinase
VAKGERLKTAERSRRGKMQKARQGKVIADGAPNYGFRFNEARDGYEVDEEKVQVIRRIFDELAGGSSINALVKCLRDEGVPSPAGAPRSWSHSQIRAIVGFDVYKPHSSGELEDLAREGLLSPGVLSGLDPDRSYGVWWYNRRKHTREKSRDRKRADGTYADVSTRVQKDRAEWVAVPVPEAGVPREYVERARARIAAGAGTRPSRAEGRFWELAGGGVLRCGECGNSMRARSVKRRKGSYTDFYYTCNNAFQKRGCDHTTLYRAEPTEREIMVAVDDVLADPGKITRDVEAAIHKERRAARDPDARMRTLAKQLERTVADREQLVRGYVSGRIRESEYDALAAELEDEESGVREEVSRVRHSSARVRELEERREALLRMFGTGLRLGLVWFPPHLRRGVYELMGLRVILQAGGGFSIEGDLDASVVRYTQEVAEYAERLQEVDERTRNAPLDVVERELERVRASMESAPVRTSAARARRAARDDPRRRGAPSAPKA